MCVELVTRGAEVHACVTRKGVRSMHTLIDAHIQMSRGVTSSPILALAGDILQKFYVSYSVRFDLAISIWQHFGS
jgi:hypothetical protein